MSVNEINLALNEGRSEFGNKILGIIGCIGAPMLLINMILFGGETNPFVGVIGSLYIIGWIAGAIGMRRERVTGRGTASTVIFLLQVMLLVLALMSNIMEICGVTLESNNALYGICDAAYPLSHLFMLVVGIFVWRAKIWRGLFRIAPFIVGFALPLFFAAVSFVGIRIGGIGFSALTAIGLMLISYAVFRGREI